MTTRQFNQNIFFAAVIWWILVAYVVVDYNLGLGTTTLRWTHPARATAAYHWDGQVIKPQELQPGDGRWFRVLLPRGMTQGKLVMQTTTPAEVNIRAETRPGVQGIVQASSGASHEVSFAWLDLVARGHSFRFRVENPSAGQALTIRSVVITTRR